MAEYNCRSCEWCEGFAYEHSERGAMPKKLEKMKFICQFRAYKGSDPYRIWCEEQGRPEDAIKTAIVGYSKKGYDEKTAKPDITKAPDFCPKRRFGL